jgi:hypothetical protein
MSQRTVRDDQFGSKPESHSPFNIGLTIHNEELHQQEVRTRQASATTAEVPVFYKAASLKDEGGLLREDGVRESWIKETEVDLESFKASQLKEPERTWGESSRGWAEGSKTWVTVNNRLVRDERSDRRLGL